MIIIIWSARRVVTALAAQLSLFFSLINSELFFPAAVIRQTRGLGRGQGAGRSFQPDELLHTYTIYIHTHTIQYIIYIYTAPLDAHTHTQTHGWMTSSIIIYTACVYIILYIYSSYNNNNIIVYRFEHAAVYIPPCGRRRCRKLLWVS